MIPVSDKASASLDFWGAAIYSGDEAALEMALTVKGEPTLEEVRGIHRHFVVIEQGLAKEGLDTAYLQRQLRVLERIREGRKARGPLRGIAGDLRGFPSVVYQRAVFRVAEDLEVYFSREDFSGDVEGLKKLHHEMQGQSFVGAFPAPHLLLRTPRDKIDEFCRLVASIETQRRAIESIEPRAWIFRLTESPFQMVFATIATMAQGIKGVQVDFELHLGKTRKLKVPAEFIPSVVEMVNLLRQVLLHFKVQNAKPQGDIYDLACTYEAEMRFLVLFYYCLCLPPNQRLFHVYEDVKPYLNRVAEIEAQENMRISFAELLQMAMEPIVHLWELMLAELGNEVMRGIDYWVGDDMELKREYARYLENRHLKVYGREFEKWFLDRNRDLHRFNRELKTKLERELHRLPSDLRAVEHERIFHRWVPTFNLFSLRLLNSMMQSEEEREQGERIFALLDRHLRIDHFHVSRVLVRALDSETLPTFEEVEEVLSQGDSEEGYFEGIKTDLLTAQRAERARREAERMARPKRQNGSPNGGGKIDHSVKAQAPIATASPLRTTGTREIWSQVGDRAWARNHAESQEQEKRARDSRLFRGKLDELAGLMSTYEGIFTQSATVEGGSFPTPEAVMERAINFEDAFRVANDLPLSNQNVTTTVYYRLASFIEEIRIHTGVLRRQRAQPQPPL